MRVMRVAVFDKKPEVDPAKHEEFRVWMAGQPGLLWLVHATDPATGVVTSVSVWNSREEVLAMKDRVFPGGPLGLKPDRVTVHDVDALHTGPAAI